MSRWIILLLFAGSAALAQESSPKSDPWALAARHASEANEAFARCHRLLYAWYKHKGTGNYLLPQNLRSRLWTAQNSAADLWSFFVLTAGWREDLKFGASVAGDVIHVYLQADKPWQGRLHFDSPRHRLHFGLPINYPRLNEFPEWYTVEPTRLYHVSVNDKPLAPMLGNDLIRGLALTVEKEPLRVQVRPMPGPPYGGKAIRIEAPPAFGAEGPFRIVIPIHNETREPQSIILITSFGRIEPAQATLLPNMSIQAILSGELSESGQVKVEVRKRDRSMGSKRTIRLVRGKGLLGFMAFDDEDYEGVGYIWCGRKPIEFSLPARRGQTHTLHLLWGSKGDPRSAIVTVNGCDYPIAQGGYRGFKWLSLKLDPAVVQADTAKIRIAPDPCHGRPAFISEAKLTCP